MTTRLGSLILCLTLAAACWGEEMFLDTLDVRYVPSGWGTTQANLSVESNPLTVAGVKFERGVGCHANFAMVLKLDGNVSRFTAMVGVDDETGKKGEVEFRIQGDGKLLWNSGPIRGGDTARAVDVELDGVKDLALVVNDCGTYVSDHADWCDAKFVFSGEKPKLGNPFEVMENHRILVLDENGVEVAPENELAREWLAVGRQIQRKMNAYVARDALHASSTILASDRDALDVATRRLVPLVNALRAMKNGPKLEAEATEMCVLIEKAQTTPITEVAARKELFAQTVALRKRIALQNPLLDFSDLLFVKRHFNLSLQGTRGPHGDIWASHMCDQFFGFHAYPGGGLFVLKDAFSDHPTVVDVLRDATVEAGRLKGRKLDSSWGFLAPELSHDTGEILFAATDTTAGKRAAYEWTEDNVYHIFRTKFDSKTLTASGLTQLTDGEVNDFDPVFLPSGRIAFISERRGGYGRCHGRPVPTYTLFSMNRDGSDITCLSFHETNEWAPVVDRNGMLVYSRWDYVDRGANQAHHPWITTPDGRDPRALQGNYHVIPGSTTGVEVPNMELDLRPVPGSAKLTATAAAHHGQSFGSLILVDPTVRDDNQMSAVRRITPEAGFPEADPGCWDCNFGTCYPLSENFYICVYDAFADKYGSHGNNYGIYLLDAFGNKVLLYRDPAISCRDAIPLRVREKEMVVPHMTLRGRSLEAGETFQPYDESQMPKTANVGLMNVYDTKYAFAEGTKIRRLRVVQVLPKTTPYGHSPAIGYGYTKNARRVLGTVPVEEDGSAYFSVPVGIPVYFQALDENGIAVQTMRSDTYVHEGEELVCQGCHEQRHTATTARSTVPQAMRRAPSALVPDPEGSSPMSYMKLVQPVLDAKCVACHAKSDDPKAINLADDNPGEHFSTSFNNLKPYCVFFNEFLWETPETFPKQFGTYGSKLYNILNSDHYGLQLTPEERYRFTTWMDTNCDFYGSYDDCERQRRGETVEPKLE